MTAMSVSNMKQKVLYVQKDEEEKNHLPVAHKHTDSKTKIASFTIGGCNHCKDYLQVGGGGRSYVGFERLSKIISTLFPSIYSIICV